MTGFHSKQDMAAGKQKEYDPCIGCLVGTVCRTPKCGRLKLPVDHPFRNAQPAQEPWDWAAHEYDGVHRKAQPAQEPVAHLWECLGRWSAYLVENGKQADCAPPSWLVDAINKATTPPLPEQEPVAHFGSAYVNENGVHITTVLGPVAIPQDAKLYTTPPQRTWIWLSDADIAEVVDTTCQYTGSYEEYLIKKAERKIRSMNNG